MSFSLHHMIALFNNWLTIVIVFPGILIIGSYFTLKLKGIQVRKLIISTRCLLNQSNGSTTTQGNISPFQAVSAVLAGNLGTGNISGMAVALSTGGPGSLVWMWIMAFLGAAIQYSSCFLGSYYRQKTAEGEFIGGPMYYLKFGMKSKWLASLFCIFTIFGAFTVGNLAQVHSIALPLTSIGFDSFSIGIVIAIFVGLVIFGGIERFAQVTSTIVPFKAVIYLGCACLILALHSDKLPQAFSLIFNEAFSFKAGIGGTLGFSVMKAITTGFERGIFATDAGTGIVPILQASTKTEHPVVTGILSILAPVTVMIVCSATALVIIVTDAWK